ncbi:lipase family protein [Nocardia asteroides]|uniref:lipase family protein n=1 Tax=Nocardia asteroides TaxID=1824 RepID=UPI0034404B8E
MRVSVTDDDEFGPRRCPTWISRARRTMACLMVIASAFVVSPAVTHNADATPDTVDPFYRTDVDLGNVAPGTILRVRPVSASAMQAVPMQAQAWQLLYRTTRADGSPYAAVTTVLTADASRPPAAILSFDSMIDAIAPECMPSRVLQDGAPWFGFDGPGGPVTLSTTASELPMIAAALQQGWAVSVPDLGGVDNHFLSPREPGFVALDGLRAIKNFDGIAGVAADTPTALWGYSGGGIATAWAAEVQPWYAPELAVAGMAIGAPVADFAAAIRNGNRSPVAGLVAVGLVGLVQDSPEFADQVDRSVGDPGRQMLITAAASCTPQNLLSFAFHDFDDYLVGISVEELVESPLAKKLLADRRLGTTVPRAPLYIYNAVGDELSTIASADELVAGYCAAGTPVTYRRDVIPSAISAHTIGWGLGAPGAFAWLTDRVERPSPPTGCEVTTTTTVADPGAASTLIPDFAGGLLAALLGTG